MKISICQSPPVYNNLEKSIERMSQLLDQVKSNQPDCVVFGECWLSGYPIWLDVCQRINIWDEPLTKRAWAETYNNAIMLDSVEMRSIQQLAKTHNIWLVFGANERIESGKGSRSIYNAVFIVDPEGKIVNHHRKLVPTFTEKLVHTHGDGYGLKSVETPFGRMGALICWEHWMPMTRQIMHDSGELIHFSLWPYVKETHQLAARHYAIEGRCYSIAVGQLFEASSLPDYLKLDEEFKSEQWLMKGGSCAFGPDGDLILPPNYKDEFIHLEIDSSKALEENASLSVSGHYQRHDVFNYSINTSRPDKTDNA